MMRSLRYQARQLGNQLILGVLLAVLMLLFSLLYPIEEIGIAIIVYFSLGLGCYLVFMNFGTNGFGTALSFGATRKGWAQATVISKAVFSFVLSIILYLVSVLFSTGTTLSPGAPLEMIPHYFMFSLFCASFGVFLGRASKDLRPVWVVLLNIIFWSILIAILIVKSIAFITNTNFILLEGTGSLVSLLAATLLLDFASWRLIRKAAVGG